WAARLDPVVIRYRIRILIGAGVLAILAVAVSPMLKFDSDPLDTKNPNTEAMHTLRDLINNPVTNPYTIDILSSNVKAAADLSAKLDKLPLVSGTISLNTFIPEDQKQKLAIIEDANGILAPTLAPHGSTTPITAD